MSKLSVTQKLIGAFGTLFVTIALFGLFILYYFNSLSSESSNVRDWLNSNFTVTEISANIADCQRNAYFLINTIGTPKNSEWRTKLEKNLQDIDAGFEHYQQVLDSGEYDTEEERQEDLKILQDEITLWKSYKATVAQLETLIATGDRAASVAYMDSEVDRAYDAIYAAINSDLASCNTGLENAVETSENQIAGFATLVHIMGIVIALILALLVAILYILVRDIKNSVDKIVSVTEKAAQGDLSHDINLTASDEFGTIAAQFNSVIKHMRKALGEVQQAATQVSESADKTIVSINKTGDLVQNVALSLTTAVENTDAQKSDIAETEQRVKNMEQSIEKSIAAMTAGLKSVEQTFNHAATGNETALATVRQMNEIAVAVEDSARIVAELGENSKEIGSIVEVISNIADQTNLLALNAAIEAARAGEHGRGFAVVADEVRKLAESSQNSVQQIGKIIGSIQKTTENAVETMQTASQQVAEGRGNVESTGNSFTEIVNMIRIAEENSRQVMTLIENMRAPIEDIVSRTEKISGTSVEIAAKMDEISVATAEQSMSVVEIFENSGTLNDLAKNMENTVHEFKI